MSTAYSKPHLPLPDQVALLESRGLAVTDPAQAQQWLSVVGYYRLSGYWYPYRVQRPDGSGRDDQFVDGTTFDQVVALYDFDRRLKLLMIDALERIEIAMRFRVGHTLGRYGAYAHLDPANMDQGFTRPHRSAASDYDQWLDKTAAAQRRSREDFVEHFRTTYDGRLPVWVVTEVLDFGGLSFLYKGLRRADRDTIAAELDVLGSDGRGNGAALANWMRALNYLRNICAHHSRLWNRNMVDQVAPKHLRHIGELTHLSVPGPPAVAARLFAPLCVTAYLLERISPSTTWTSHVTDLITSSLPATGRTTEEMGFPSGWQSLPLWPDAPRTPQHP